MRKLGGAGLTFGALMTAAALGACGGASPATSATLSASVRAAANGSVAVSPQPGTPSEVHCSAAAKHSAATERPEPGGPVISQACVMVPWSTSL